MIRKGAGMLDHETQRSILNLIQPTYLKAEISSHFGERPENVYLVGSAKLGFSIAPHKLWQPFSDESDIDVVIISEDLFKSLWVD